MKKLNIVILLMLFIFYTFLSTPISYANGDNSVFLITLDREIDGALPRILRRAINEAEMSKVDLIILEINSPGGYIKEAGQIRDILVSTDIPIYAFVNNNAFSAAAFLALACDRIYMTPQGAIGDAQVILADGQPAPEKIISAWDGQMRSLAEARGRDPEIASAMVRIEKEIEGLVSKNELLTLTANQALQYGYCEGIYNSIEELLTALNYHNPKIIKFEQSLAETLARFITAPQVASILLSVGMFALIIEVFSSGFGIAGIISIISFTLFFGGHIIAGFANLEFIILFILGILLLIAEMFFAGFGILGVGGVTLIFLSVIFTARSVSDGLVILGWAILFTIILLVVFYKLLAKSKRLDKLVLKQQENKEQGYIASAKYENLLGKEGKTITMLRPSGIAEIDGQRYDVVSEGSFISSNTKIKVVKVGSNNIVVKKID
ncbi:membrane-bound serine protease (ClpP class) [Anaerobranca californiensis DSM 14826]|uniref:Membrane-bound serine protease (ClpP class) n=1 Tax=Anaerobranca californiensis DSM 14826 TaxID=1120989 RepID=A0A1M6N569_9FIRM|nr:NfeD family protein [Anaerobranca californiensis]SHJ90808.1 membrane-bound serine protease (ClpP class) [Anaerobranca californiensis DSM 14826]